MRTVALILAAFVVAAYANEENQIVEVKKDLVREKRSGWGPNDGATSQRGFNQDYPSGLGSPHAGASDWNSGSNAPVARSSVNYQIEHIPAPSGWQQGGAAPWNAGRTNNGLNNGWNVGRKNVRNNGWDNGRSNGWNNGWNSGSNGGWNGVNGGGLSNNGYGGAWNNGVNSPRGSDLPGPSSNGWSSHQQSNNW